MTEVASRLLRTVNPERDHVRGDPTRPDAMELVLYGDYLCPYCRSLRHVLISLREGLGDRLVYVFRHFPNESSHPGADFASWAAEAAGLQGKFWDMHDALYAQQPPLTRDIVLKLAEQGGIDMPRLMEDITSPDVQARVATDKADGRHNGVTGTPTMFIDGARYDGAWDFDSLLEALERPLGAKVQRTARAFANIPASAGVMLLIGAAAALICANTSLAPYYQTLVDSPFAIGPPGAALSLTVRGWSSEGLLTIFFLIVGLELRREMTTGALTDRRAALLPALAACGGVLAPTAIYLALNRGVTAPGWSVPTATDVAFTLGILALLGKRVPIGVRVFVAALAVVDDVLSMVTLAIFYAHAFRAIWLVPAALCAAAMFALNRWRVYALWPFLVVALGLWISFHAAGVHAALAGVLLATFIPTRRAPAAEPLLAQAATALAELRQAEIAGRTSGVDGWRIENEPIWDWASRNLSAASQRLMSPAERVERAVSPWSAYLVLPLFAFSATGVALALDLGSRDSRQVFLGVVLGLSLGKPTGICLASWLAIKTKVGIGPGDMTIRHFIGAAALCGVGDTVSLLMADQAFPSGPFASVAKIGVLAGSVLAALIGVVILTTTKPPQTQASPVVS